jgi:hypothetical protein
MTSLRKARDEGKVEEFAAKRETDTPPGDEAKFNRVLGSMAGKSKAAPTASKPDRSDD